MGQDPNFTYKTIDMLSIMHVKNAFWISLFLRFFSWTIIVISRNKGSDKLLKSDMIHYKMREFSHTFLKLRTKRSKQILNIKNNECGIFSFCKNIAIA